MGMAGKVKAEMVKKDFGDDVDLVVEKKCCVGEIACFNFATIWQIFI